MKRFLWFLAAAAVLLLAGCAPSEYDVELRLKDLSWEGDHIAVEGKDFSGTLMAAADHQLPAALEASVDGNVLPQEQYSYDSGSGQLSIPGEYITGPVQLQAEAQLRNFSVTVDSQSGLLLEGENQALPGQEYRTTLLPEEYYQLPDKITVQVDGVDLPKDEYTYDSATGELVITGSVDGDVVIFAQAAPVSYPLQMQLVGVSISEIPEELMPAYGYAAVLSCLEGYRLPIDVQVSVDGELLASDAYSYDAVTGALEIPGSVITGPVQLSCNGAALISGSWSTVVDISDYVAKELSSSDPTMSAYFDFHDLSFTMLLHLKENGQGSVEIDSASLDDMSVKVQAQMLSGMKAMLQELLQAQGFSMDVDTYLEIAGIDLEAQISDSLDFSSLKGSVGSSGSYLVEGNRLYLSDSNGEYQPEDYIVFSLKGDTLVFESSGAANDLVSNFGVLTFTRIG